MLASRSPEARGWVPLGVVRSTGVTDRERERRGLADLGEAARAQVGQQRELEDLVGLVPILVPQGVFVGRGRHHVADDQAVRPEAVQDAVQRAFEEQVAPSTSTPSTWRAGKVGSTRRLGLDWSSHRGAAARLASSTSDGRG